MAVVSNISKEMPVLIAGPTASGKSALAMEIAARQDRIIVNADAIQVFANWRVLTARPSEMDEARQDHRLYGHIPADAPYSVGRWLCEVKPLLAAPERLIIVGGTGLYFSALTEGLADIPETTPEIRAAANAFLRKQGLAAMVASLDITTAARIDRQNPMRVQRAWEVARMTGRGLAAWQDNTPPPLLPLSRCTPLLVSAEKEWLNPRIENRFDQIIARGALDEARANLQGWDPGRLSSKAIGAPELIAHLKGEMSLNEARDAATASTRQFAKRQRTWFRARMRDWRQVPAAKL